MCLVRLRKEKYTNWPEYEIKIKLAITKSTVFFSI